MMTRIAVFLLFSLVTGLFLPVTGISQNASVSGFVWDDLNSNGLQDTLEPGLPGVVVILENGDSTVATQPTDSTGNYTFSGLPADSFRLEFVNPGGLFLTLQNVGPNDSLDSDADPNGFVGFFALADSQDVDFDAGFSATPVLCTISGAVDSILCSDNNTPADPTDDTYTFLLTVSGGVGTWSVTPDTTLFAYDSAFVFGPFPISGGLKTLIVAESGDSTCTDTIAIVPPAPCSAVDTCTTPVTATVGAVTCNNNGTPNDATDDIFTFELTVTGGTGTWSGLPDTLDFPYDSTITFGPFPISGGPITRLVTDNADSLCTDSVTVNPPAVCSCQNPIVATFSDAVCNNNGTPNDATDDIFTFQLTVTGGTGTWSALPDTLDFPFDSTITFGPFPISGGPVTRFVTDNTDAFCVDTVAVAAPAVCSCQTPISATFSDLVCNDNGTSNDSTDDVFTFKVVATGGTGTWSALPDTTAYAFDSTATFGPFPIDSGVVTLLVRSNTDTFCVDTVTVTPPAPCSVPVNACDVKEIGCIKFELLSVTFDSLQKRTYTIQLTNNCTNKLIYTAFQLPKGITAKAPDDNTIYIAPSGREYEVRNPNFSPFYSIRFKSMVDSIGSGQSDIFKYTLPAQAKPDYIHAIVRVWPKVFYEVHLNTFNCPLTQMNFKQIPGKLKPNVTPPTTPGAGPGTGPGNATTTAPQFQVYPNPTAGGAISVDLLDWAGQAVELQLFNGQGQVILTQTTVADDVPLEIELPTGLDAGIYWLRMKPANGKPQIQRLVLQW